MKQIFKLLSFVLLTFLLTGCPNEASAQSGFTNVTAQVLDPSGNTYSNCSYNVDFIGQAIGSTQPYAIGGTSPFQQSFGGAKCDSSGNMSIRIADNLLITPTPSQWKFSICNSAGAICFNTTLTITGNSQVITANLQAASASLSTGPLNQNVKILNNIRFADQFTGANWGAKVQAADTDLGGTAGEIWLNLSAGTSAPAANIILSANHILRVIQGGTYNLGTRRILLNNGSGIISPYTQPTSQTPVVFSYTGSSSAIAPANTGAITYNVVLQGFDLTGTASGTIGIDLYNANTWLVSDVGVTGFSTGVGVRLFNDLLGGFYNIFTRVYINTAITGILLTSNTALNGPNRNSFYDVNITSVTTGVNIDTGDTQNFYALKVNGASSTGIIFNSTGAVVHAANLENGSPGTSLAVNFTNIGNAVGMNNYFLGTVGNFNTIVGNVGNNEFHLIPAGTGANVGTRMNVRGNSQLPAAVNDTTLYAAGSFGSPSAGRLYTGDGSGFRLEFAKRTASTDTVNAWITDAGLGNFNGGVTTASVTSSGRVSTPTISSTSAGQNLEFGINNGVGVPWYINGSTNALLPNSDAAVNIGAAGSRAATVFTSLLQANTATFGGGSTLNLYKTVTDTPGAITITAQTCTDRGVALAGSGTGATIHIAANYTLDANIILSPGQAVAGTVHYRICNPTAVNITLNAAATFNLAVVQ